MKQVVVNNVDRPDALPVVAAYCDTFFSRLFGYSFRRSIKPDQGILLVQARDSRMDASIHMLGVFTDLAIVWINDAQQVVDTCLARRWRPLYVPKRPSRYVLEINPGRLHDYQVGDRVSFD